MSFREAFNRIAEVIGLRQAVEQEELAKELLAPLVIPARGVFAEGICDICQKQMQEHSGSRDCRGNEFTLIKENVNVDAKPDGAIAQP